MIKMKWIYLLFLVALLVSCGSDKKDKVENWESIRPKDEENKQVKNQQEKDTLAPYLETYKHDSILLEIIKIIPITSTEFLNRFSKSYLDFELETPDTALYIRHSTWNFKDSIATMNAFYNWLDEDQGTRLGGKLKKTSNFTLWIITKNGMDRIESNQKIEPEIWWNCVRFQRNITVPFYVISQPKNRPSSWLVRDAKGKWGNQKITL
ncbi:MAG: hypothetical protein RL264_1214 [Bacteroidota bacterium]|jgi:hypothetical protein